MSSWIDSYNQDMSDLGVSFDSPVYYDSGPAFGDVMSNSLGAFTGGGGGYWTPDNSYYGQNDDWYAPASYYESTPAVFQDVPAVFQDVPSDYVNMRAYPASGMGNDAEILSDYNYSDDPMAAPSRGFLGETREFLKDNGDLLSWGAAGIGGLASYLDAKNKAKLMKKGSKQTAAANQAVRQEAAERREESLKYNAPQYFTLARTRNEDPDFSRGEANFFNNNALSANPSRFAEGGSVEGRWMETGEYDENNVPRVVWVSEEVDRPRPQTRQEPKKLSPLERLGSLFGVTETIKKGQRERERYASGGYASGGTPGQSDMIPAMLSSGEFVIDADTVAALGDGNNAAGASALERMRRNVRKHKRSAPANKIPPKSKKPEQYMKGKK